MEMETRARQGGPIGTSSTGAAGVLRHTAPFIGSAKKNDATNKMDRTIKATMTTKEQIKTGTTLDKQPMEAIEDNKAQIKTKVEMAANKSQLTKDNSRVPTRTTQHGDLAVAPQRREWHEDREGYNATRYQIHPQSADTAAKAQAHADAKQERPKINLSGARAAGGATFFRMYSATSAQDQSAHPAAPTQGTMIACCAASVDGDKMEHK